MTPLQTLITDRLAELDRTFREAADHANGLITHGHINQLTLGRASASMRPKTIGALALALDLPRQRVQDAVDASKGDEPTSFVLPKQAEGLGPKQRKAVLALVDALLDLQKPD